MHLENDIDKSTSIGVVKGPIQRRKWTDLVFAAGGLVTMVLALAVLLALLGQLVMDGIGRLSWQFLTSYPSRFPTQAGILSAWIGTVIVMILTALAAVPLGIGAAIYLEEYARHNWVTDLIEINIANLAGVPSIVYGLMALGLFVYQFHLGRVF